MKRIALNSYGPIATGLGSEAKWLVRLLPIAKWFIGRHRLGFGPIEEVVAGRETVAVDMDSTNPHGCLDGVDVLVAIERPLDIPLFRAAKAKKIRTVLLCNPEWTVDRGSPSFLELFDLVVARTPHALLYLHAMPSKPRAIRAPAIIDLDEFPFTLREKAERAVYVHGWGGVKDRKGYPEVEAMLRLMSKADALEKAKTLETMATLRLDRWADIDPAFGVTIKSQRKGWQVASKSADLYADADVLLMPSRFEGLGLPLLEAMASGCLVLATHADPMATFLNAAYRCEAQEMCLPLAKTADVEVSGRPWPAHFCSPEGMAARLRACREFPADKVRRLSLAGRAYVEKRHGPAAVAELLDTILHA